MSSQRIAVIGAGHLGSIHAKLAQQHPQATLAAIVEPNESARNAAGQQLGAPVFATVAELPKDISAAIIATNTPSHREVAVELLSRGVPCLVEKPLALTATDAWRIIDASRAADATLAVGHTERFNPAFLEAQRRVYQPKYITATRACPYLFRSVDVGVVHDLMIHDLDMLLALVDDDPVDVSALGVAVFGPYEDMATARITFAGGCVADLTASRTSPAPQRTMNIFAESGFAALDFQTRVATFVDPIEAIRTRTLDVHALPAERQAQVKERLFEDYLQTSVVEPPETNPLLNEQADFLQAARTGAAPRVTGEAAAAAIALAERVLAAIAAHRWDGAETGRRGPHFLPTRAIVPGPRVIDAEPEFRKAG